MIILTDKGKVTVNQYLLEIQAKRKEILDAKKDTADETPMPTANDIIDDIELIGLDDDNCYRNGWGCTDNYEADYPICLMSGVDFIICED